MTTHGILRFWATYNESNAGSVEIGEAISVVVYADGFDNIIFHYTFDHNIGSVLERLRSRQGV
ncbi:MAG: hypothetical protein ACRC2T_06915 [Thermoguttaceae bacterium]